MQCVGWRRFWFLIWIKSKWVKFNLLLLRVGFWKMREWGALGHLISQSVIGYFFEYYKDKAGEWRWRLNAGNQETMAIGESYVSECFKGINKIFCEKCYFGFSLWHNFNNLIFAHLGERVLKEIMMYRVDKNS